MDKKFYSVISMMSGTSMDGCDACLVRLSDNFEYKIDGFYSLEYPQDVRKKLLDIAVGNGNTADICFLNFVVGKHFAKCANLLLEKYNLKKEKIDFISSHGQTVYHIPQEKEIGGYRTKSTLQIGDISVIAGNTGITTIGDFRPRDMAAGGQGAPLVPFADEKIFGKDKNRAIQNIGGIANVTVLSKDIPTFAFDNSVGNMLIDYFSHKFFGKNYDKDGLLAKQGKVDEEWLDELMKDEYYALVPPKTTGREHFNDKYAENILKTAPENKYDIIRTVTELTAKAIYKSYEDFVFPKTSIDEVVIGGGGAYNPVLMQALQKYFGQIPVKTHDDYGICSQHKECLAFAILGLCTLLKKTNNLPECTGAAKAVVMGKIAY
ncbi:MAG: anhydro-N-acetylmuramic acid kinase [Candidatus Gastranaerophilales bacterium]|nr:anhydro-N-acetylmuramic acid kinase [Candidatus Gastranaerophilales bacterium]